MTAPLSFAWYFPLRVSSYEEFFPLKFPSMVKVKSKEIWGCLNKENPEIISRLVRKISHLNGFITTFHVGNRAESHHKNRNQFNPGNRANMVNQDHVKPEALNEIIATCLIQKILNFWVVWKANKRLHVPLFKSQGTFSNFTLRTLLVFQFSAFVEVIDFNKCLPSRLLHLRHGENITRASLLWKTKETSQTASCAHFI